MQSTAFTDLRATRHPLGTAMPRMKNDNPQAVIYRRFRSLRCVILPIAMLGFLID